MALHKVMGKMFWAALRYMYMIPNCICCCIIATSDYAPVNSVLVFPAGASEGYIQCINVTILHDEIVEGTESFMLRLSRVGETSLIVIDPTRYEATLSIVDDESKAMYYFMYIPHL